MKTALVWSLLLPTAVSAHAGATFTYQGVVREAGSPITGACDLEFSLYSVDAGGTPVAPTVTHLDIQVVAGQFTVPLDFGTGAWHTEAERWLEIAVRYPAGGGNYTTLDPRQPITRAPYAIATRDVYVNEDATFTGIGRVNPITPKERFGVHSDATSGYAGMYMHTYGAGAWPFYGYATAGVAKAWHYYDHQGYWRLNNGGLDRLSVSQSGKVGIGIQLPLYALDVDGDDEIAIQGISTFVGVRGKSLDGSGVQGLHTGNGWGVGVTGHTGSAEGFGVQGNAIHPSGVTVGVQGNATSPAGYDFFAAGAGTDYGSSSSRRWKRNIEVIREPLDKVTRLRGVTFDWDETHGGHHDIGMIAEETGEVIPEIVTYEPNGIDAVGMDYSRLTPLLIEAVKALSDEIAALRAQQNAELEALRAERDAVVAALTVKLSSLETTQF